MRPQRLSPDTEPRPLPSPAAAAELAAREAERTRRAVVFGAEPDVARVSAHPAADRGHFSIVGVQLLGGAEQEPAALSLDQALACVEAAAAGVIIVAGEVGQRTLRTLADAALVRDCRLVTLMPTDLLPGYAPEVIWEGETPLIQLAQPPHGWLVRAAKRGIDVLGAGLGLLLSAPLLALLMLAIRLESPGPALFRHRRLGRGQRPFACLKLRTMRDDAEQLLARDPALREAYRANHYKIPDDQDPRLTRLGRWLRRSSLDELPQLWNVLRGDMSLVGPRPIVPAELEHYPGTEALLLSVRPGITGAWAANGRHHVGYPQRAALELRYVRAWTLGGDLLILLKTVRAVTDYQSGPLEG